MEKRTLHQFANAGVFGNAEMLRASMTHTEKMLWEELKNKKLRVKFRRQHPLGIYVLDFYCHELGLVIEVDGEYHFRPLQRIDDIEKDQILKEAGLTILRITDQEITDQITTTIEKIQCLIKIVKNR